jgi:hypothetical protein
VSRAVVLLGFLLVLSLWESAAALIGPRRAPSEAEWAAVERFVRAEHRAGDLIAFAPRWLDPVGRAHLGDLIPLGAAARPDADAYPRVIAVSWGGARVADTKDRTAEKQVAGRLSAGIFTAAPPEVSYDFVAHLADEGVEAAGAVVRIAEVDYAPHRCIWIAPRPGAPRSIVFPGVKLGRTLVGYTGLDHFQQRKLGKGLVELAVYVGDQLKERIIHSNDSGWRRFEIDTSGSAGQSRPVRFDVSAPDPRHRLFCFTAEARM